MTVPIRSAAKNYPQHLAFIDGPVEVSYKELIDRIEDFSANRLANFTSGQHVAWCPFNDLESLVTFWAILDRGLVACPVSFRIAEKPRNKIVQSLNAIWLPDSEIKDSDDKGIFEACGRPDLQSPATIILSSGSTGQPKAVVHSLAAHIASAQGAATNMPIKPGDRWLWSLPLFHVSGLSIPIRCALAGATVVGTSEERKLSAKALADAKVSHLSVVGTQLRRLLEEPAFPSKSLDSVLLGGSSVDPKIVQTARSRGVGVLTTYGLSETASQVSTSANGDDPLSSGKVLPGREVNINDSGEILVRGKTLCLGYYQDGKIYSVVDDQGWFATRDLGEFDASDHLYVRGRIDNMFISGGENIYPETIERTILSLFKVNQAFVIPKSDPEYGQRPVVFVDGQLPSDWQAVLRGSLQGFEVPVQCFEIPAKLKDAVKVSRMELRELLSGH